MAKISSLRKKLGDYCHFCGYKIDFSLIGTTSGEGPTRDHIIPKHLIRIGASDGKGQKILLAHATCNSIRGLGEEDAIKNPKFLSFVERLEKKGVPRNPKYNGPINHNIEIPKTDKVLSFYIVVLGIQFDLKWVPGRYWHLRIGSKTIDMLALAGKKGR